MLYFKWKLPEPGCPDCPVKCPNKSKLELHRNKHHTGNEKYRCTASDCSWGCSTANGLALHRLRYHGDAPPSRGTVQPIPKNSAYERESIVESSASGWSHDFEASTVDDPKSGETFSDPLVASSFSNKGAPFSRPMSPLAPTTNENCLWMSPATGFQHGGVRCSSEAKQLYPAASTNSLDDDLLGPDPFLGGYRALGDNDLSYSDDGTIDSYGSMADARGRTITFGAPILINPAPPQSHVSAVVYPGSYQASWNESNVGTLRQNMEYGTIENYGQGPPITYASERTSLNDLGPEYTAGPSSSRAYYVDDQGHLRCSCPQAQREVERGTLFGPWCGCLCYVSLFRFG
ncbi:hypothetical protein ARMSODRAFT_1011517 [Armillaria solidipes]|uniref:C2H2-type domain-containing protein n=1 Tax=Armillaria solidipes TaxID=1076256 RepID=A0A2H3CAI3_9AGAR|nr:hypothetical protein ARMSODRAFT_1011517 [Armillaria solidipes]